MNRTEYLKYLSDQASGKKVNPSQILVELQVFLQEINQNAKYYNNQWYLDQLENYRQIAKGVYQKVLNDISATIRTTDQRIKEVEARAFQYKGESQDYINLINSLIVRMATEIKLNPDNAASILDRYKNSEEGAKAIVQGISDGKFDAGIYTKQILEDALLKSKSKAEIAFEAQKVKDIEKIKAEGLNSSDYGSYLAIQKLSQLGQIDQDVNKLISEAKASEKEKEEFFKMMAVNEAIVKGQVVVPQ